MQSKRTIERKITLTLEDSGNKINKAICDILREQDAGLILDPLTVLKIYHRHDDFREAVRDAYMVVFDQCQGNVTAVGKLLGMSRQAVYESIKSLDISSEDIQSYRNKTDSEK